MAQRKRQRRRGASLLECAILLPLVLGLVFGCVDFGRYAYDYIAITNAVREGASVGSTTPFGPDSRPQWDQKVRDAVVAELQSIGGFDETKLQMPPPVVTVDPYGVRRLTLEVTYPFETVVDWPLIPHQINLNRIVDMPFIR